jgi:hypothetical protein
MTAGEDRGDTGQDWLASPYLAKHGLDCKPDEVAACFFGNAQGTARKVRKQRRGSAEVPGCAGEKVERKIFIK